MIFKANTPYRHKATKTVIVPIKNVEVLSKWLFDQYEEMPREEPEPRKQEQTYVTKKLVEKNTGVTE